MEQHKPTVLALVICDSCRKEDNGKSILVGTFSKLGVIKFPSALPSMGVYCAMSSVPASGHLAFIYRTEDKSFSLPFPPQSLLIQNKTTPPDHRQTFEFGVNFGNLPIPKPGTYEVVVVWDGNEIAQRVIEFVQASPPQPLPPGSPLPITPRL
jgi:hypothetical protein